MNIRRNEFNLYCFGNSTYDHIFYVDGYSGLNSYGNINNDALCFGGKSANVAYTASQFLKSVGVTLTIGSNFKEIGYYDHLKNSSLDFNINYQFKVNRLTPRFFSLYDGINSYTFLDSITNFANLNKLESFCKEIIKSIKTNCIFSCFADQKLNLSVFKLAKKLGVSKISYNLVDNLAQQSLEFQKNLLSLLDILFLNHNECKYLSKAFNSNIFDIQSEFSISIVVVTMGSKGCEIYNNGKKQLIDSEGITNIVDPVGAGDCFAGAFLGNYLKNGDPHHAGQLAQKVARACVQNFGSQIDFSTEIEGE